MYFCHVDPSGQSKPDPECPLCVFSCVIVQEKQYPVLRALCDQCIADLVPKRHQKGFEFHARKLFPINSDKYKGWPCADRRKVMQAGLQIIADLELPIRYCLIEKARHAKIYKSAAYDPMLWGFTVCLEQVEKWFLDEMPDEAGLIITDRCKNRKEEQQMESLYQEYLRGNLPHSTIKLEHLWDIMSFADSRFSVGVQMSDLCSYVISRHCRKMGDVKTMHQTIAAYCRGRKLPRGACGPFSHP